MGALRDLAKMLEGFFWRTKKGRHSLAGILHLCWTWFEFKRETAGENTRWVLLEELGRQDHIQNEV